MVLKCFNFYLNCRMRVLCDTGSYRSSSWLPVPSGIPPGTLNKFRLFIDFYFIFFHLNMFVIFSKMCKWMHNLARYILIKIRREKLSKLTTRREEDRIAIEVVISVQFSCYLSPAKWTALTRTFIFVWMCNALEHATTSPYFDHHIWSTISTDVRGCAQGLLWGQSQ